MTKERYYSENEDNRDLMLTRKEIDKMEISTEPLKPTDYLVPVSSRPEAMMSYRCKERHRLSWEDICFDSFSALLSSEFGASELAVEVGGFESASPTPSSQKLGVTSSCSKPRAFPYPDT